MDGALVNAGSHNPPSNVFYMLHKALGGGHSQNQGTAWDGAKCNLTTSNTLPWCAMHEILLLQLIFLVKPYLLGMNFLKNKK
jgi:hypothetical protein